MGTFPILPLLLQVHHPCSLYSLEGLAHLLGLGDLVLLKAWILKVTLVLAKLQGESKAHFCVAWCYKIKAAICTNLFNMTFFHRKELGSDRGTGYSDVLKV